MKYYAVVGRGCGKTQLLFSYLNYLADKHKEDEFIMAGKMGNSWHTEADLRRIKELENDIKVRDNNIESMKREIQSLKDKLSASKKMMDDHIKVVNKLADKYSKVLSDIESWKKSSRTYEEYWNETRRSRNELEQRYGDLRNKWWTLGQTLRENNIEISEKVIDGTASYTVKNLGNQSETDKLKKRYEDVLEDLKNANIELNILRANSEGYWKDKYTEEVIQSVKFRLDRESRGWKMYDDARNDIRNLKDENQHLRDTIAGQCKKITKLQRKYSDYDDLKKSVTDLREQVVDQAKQIVKWKAKYKEVRNGK